MRVAITLLCITALLTIGAFEVFAADSQLRTNSVTGGVLMGNGVTRRQLLRIAGTTTAAILAEPLFKLGLAEAAVPIVRRDVGRMAASDPILTAYRKAIAAMQALPATNPL